mmetsp:Transcript_24617/g.69187  ORF Transcript_24617/g.69187 Transcript_24617/m.69187 type:complete len:498 (-) Transcript_24617:30-1523(-)
MGDAGAPAVCERCGKKYRNAGKSFQKHVERGDCRFKTGGRKDQHLTWLGSKHDQCELILNHIPEGLTRVVSPFWGSGAVELALLRSRPKLRVHASDADTALIAFWQQMQASPGALVSELEKMVPRDFPVSREEYQTLQHTLACSSEFYRSAPLQLAAAFWVLNRLHFNGIMSSLASYEPTKAAILLHRRQHVLRHLGSFDPIPSRRLRLEARDWLGAVESSPAGALIFADPPYLAERSKGREYASSSNWGMQDHERLRDALARRQRWILCHRDCPQIRELYRGHHVVEYREQAGVVRRKGIHRNELLILSPWVAQRLPEEAMDATAARTFRTWRCPIDGCSHAVTGWTDSLTWRSRGLHLKRHHAEWCVSPCPRTCEQGCSACIAHWLLQGSEEQTPPCSAEESAGLGWSCPVPGCGHAAVVAVGPGQWPSDRSRHLKEAHPSWCIFPCPRGCAWGCPSCIPLGLLGLPALAPAAPGGHGRKRLRSKQPDPAPRRRR